MYELTFFYGGTATLTDTAGGVLWSSQNDAAFIDEFDELVTIDECDYVEDWLLDNGYLPEEAELTVIESDAQGVRRVSDDLEEDEDEDDEDFDEDEDEDEDE